MSFELPEKAGAPDLTASVNTLAVKIQDRANRIVASVRAIFEREFRRLDETKPEFEEQLKELILTTKGAIENRIQSALIESGFAAHPEVNIVRDKDGTFRINTDIGLVSTERPKQINDLYVGPKLDALPKLYVQVEQIREKRVRVRLVFGHVDATLPYPNPESKVYSDEEIRLIIGTFLAEKRLFSFEDDILTIAWGGEDHHLVIDIGHDIHSWGDKLPYYWYHTALSMAEILCDVRNGIFGMVTEYIKHEGKVIGYRFQPCAVPGLVMRAQEHLDD